MSKEREDLSTAYFRHFPRICCLRQYILLYIYILTVNIFIACNCCFIPFVPRFQLFYSTRLSRLGALSLFIVTQDLFHRRNITWCYTAASVSFYIAKKKRIYISHSYSTLLLACVGWITGGYYTSSFSSRSTDDQTHRKSWRFIRFPFFSLLSSPAFSCTTAVSVARKAISALLLSNIIPSKFTWVSNFRTSGSSWFISGFRWMLCAYNNQWFIDA